jgi:hypothetical protein
VYHADASLPRNGTKRVGTQQIGTVLREYICNKKTALQTGVQSKTRNDCELVRYFGNLFANIK